MFIENLRSVKKKWKIPALILIILLVLGLLSSFAYLGSSIGNVGGGSNAEGIDYYAKAAENAEKAVKKDNAESILAAVSAYDDYATYQVLYLDNGSTKSYEKMQKFAKDLLALYATQETEADAWSAAYMYAIRADLALNDVEAARAAFNESLSTITLSSEYLSNYAAALGAKELYAELAEDMSAAVAVLQPLADAEAPAEDAEAEGNEATDTEDGAETMSDVLATAQSNAQYAEMMVTMNNPDAGAATDADTDADAEAEATE